MDVAQISPELRDGRLVHSTGKKYGRVIRNTQSNSGRKSLQECNRDVKHKLQASGWHKGTWFYNLVLLTLIATADDVLKTNLGDPLLPAGKGFLHLGTALGDTTPVLCKPFTAKVLRR